MKQLNWYQIFGKSNIPDGRTVLPTDDIQIWLNCANIWDKAYTTLYEVLNDTATLSALMASDNAVDYLVRSTSWAVPVSVPVMTSNTEPSGICLCDSNVSGEEAYKAFDKNNSTYWESNIIGTTGGQWLGYKFSTPQIVSYLKNRSSAGATNYVKVQYSDDDVNWVDTGDTYNIKNSDGDKKVSLTVDSVHYSYRIYCTSASSNTRLATTELNFYSPSISESEDAMALIGANDYAAETLLADATWCAAIGNSEYRESVLNIKTPNMTSATTPSGKVTAKTQAYGAAYLAFDGNAGTAWLSDYNVVGQWIDYEFPESVDILIVCTTNINNVNFCPRTAKYKISEDGVTYSEVCSMNQDIIAGASFVTIPSSPASGNHHRIELTAGYENAGRAGYAEVQFYGRQIGGVQTWLRAAGITDKLYTTVSEVLADSTTLTALMSSHSAVDYLVTAKGWADDICADSGAMTAIGNNNYCANTLLADVTWCEAICKSDYWESVLSPLVPEMTSNTTPSGIASQYGTPSGSAFEAYKAFDRSNTTHAEATFTRNDTWHVRYEFPTAVKCYVGKYIAHNPSSATYSFSMKMQRSADGVTWTDISSSTTQSISGGNTYSSGKIIFTSFDDAKYYQFCSQPNNYYAAGATEVQFYGRKDV